MVASPFTVRFSCDRCGLGFSVGPVLVCYFFGVGVSVSNAAAIEKRGHGCVEGKISNPPQKPRNGRSFLSVGLINGIFFVFCSRDNDAPPVLLYAAGGQVELWWFGKFENKQKLLINAVIIHPISCCCCCCSFAHAFGEQRVSLLVNRLARRGRGG